MKPCELQIIYFWGKCSMTICFILVLHFAGKQVLFLHYLLLENKFAACKQVICISLLSCFFDVALPDQIKGPQSLIVKILWKVHKSVFFRNWDWEEYILGFISCFFKISVINIIILCTLPSNRILWMILGDKTLK